VTPLAYHFEKPMIVTNVGGLPDLVPHEKVGLVCEPHPQAIADAILNFYHFGENYFVPQLRIEKKKYEWNQMTDAILQVAKNVNIH
jgi:glycosyltransferase involved in cell wall biosynthesis